MSSQDPNVQSSMDECKRTRESVEVHIKEFVSNKFLQYERSMERLREKVFDKLDQINMRVETNKTSLRLGEKDLQHIQETTQIMVDMVKKLDQSVDASKTMIEGFHQQLIFTDGTSEEANTIAENVQRDLNGLTAKIDAEMKELHKEFEAKISILNDRLVVSELLMSRFKGWLAGVALIPLVVAFLGFQIDRGISRDTLDKSIKEAKGSMIERLEEYQRTHDRADAIQWEQVFDRIDEIREDHKKFEK